MKIKKRIKILWITLLDAKGLDPLDFTEREKYAVLSIEAPTFQVLSDRGLRCQLNGGRFGLKERIVENQPPFVD